MCHSTWVKMCFAGSFRIHRRYRGVDYDIEVVTEGTEKGVKEMLVDGAKVDGNIIPFDASKSHVDVRVIMG